MIALLLLSLFLNVSQGAKKPTLAIFDFKKVGEVGEEELGKSISGALFRAMNNVYFKAVNVVETEKIREKLKKEGITKAVDDTTLAARMAQSVGADKAIIGTYEKLGPSYRIDATLIDCNTEETITVRKAKSQKSSASIIQACNKLASMLVKDIQGEPVQATIGDQKDVAINTNPTFKVSLWTDRGHGETYYIGDNLHVYFETSKDCYLTIFDIGTSGNIIILFPNEYSNDNLIKADNEYSFPDENDPFYYQILGPPGEEFLKGICTIEDIQLTREEYINKTGIFSEVETSYTNMSKDVAVILKEEKEKKKEVKWADDSTYFIVKE